MSSVVSKRLLLAVLVPRRLEVVIALSEEEAVIVPLGLHLSLAPRISTRGAIIVVPLGLHLSLAPRISTRGEIVVVPFGSDWLFAHPHPNVEDTSEPILRLRELRPRKRGEGPSTSSPEYTVIPHPHPNVEDTDYNTDYNTGFENYEDNADDSAEVWIGTDGETYDYSNGEMTPTHYEPNTFVIGKNGEAIPMRENEALILQVYYSEGTDKLIRNMEVVQMLESKIHNKVKEVPHPHPNVKDTSEPFLRLRELRPRKRGEGPSTFSPEYTVIPHPRKGDDSQ